MDQRTKKPVNSRILSLTWYFKKDIHVKEIIILYFFLLIVSRRKKINRLWMLIYTLQKKIFLDESWKFNWITKNLKIVACLKNIILLYEIVLLIIWKVNQALRDIYKSCYLYFICILYIAIRCEEPDEIVNGVLERKCQTFGCRYSSLSFCLLLQIFYIFNRGRCLKMYVNIHIITAI